MEKSFGELLTDSFSAFKKSVLPVFGIWGILFGVILICGIVLALIIVGIVGVQALNNIRNPMFLMAYAVPVIGIIIAFSFIYYIFFAWMILVVRNNIIAGQSFFKETFFEAARKIFKIIFLGVLMLLFYTAIGFMCILLLKKYGIFLMLPLFLITGPAIFTTFYAVLCREGGFWEIISEAISLSFNRWFKIIGYTLLFGICCMAVFLAVGYGITSVFESIKLVPIGSLIFSLFQICFMVFQQCFCTALYLDLANVKPQQEIEVRETLDDEPILKQNIEQHVEQKPMQSSNDNQEPPHMDVLK